MAKIFLTGAAGFIGFHVAQQLLGRGDEVLSIDNLNDYYDPALKHSRLEILESEARFRFEKLDLTEGEAIQDLVADYRPDRVVHLAAQAGVRYSIKNPKAYIDSNVVGFLNILEACRHNEVGHLVYASSSSVYGANEEMPFSVHHNVDHPVSLYAASKKANELMAHSYSHLFKLPTTGLRFFTVYGPWGRPDMAVAIFTRKILAGEPIEIFNQGAMKRDFTFVDDIVEGVIRVMDKPATPNPSWTGLKPDPGSSKGPYRIYNIGNHNPVPLMELVETLESLLGRKAEKHFMPMQAGDVTATYADISELAQEFGFQPKTTLKDGLAEFVKWHLGYYKTAL